MPAFKKDYSPFSPYIILIFPHTVPSLQDQICISASLLWEWPEDFEGLLKEGKYLDHVFLKSKTRINRQKSEEGRF